MPVSSVYKNCFVCAKVFNNQHSNRNRSAETVKSFDETENKPFE